MGLIKTLSKFSLGLVLILVWGFMWLRADILFPTNTEVWRLDYILPLIVLVAFVFSFDTLTNKTERSLFKVSFLKRFPAFLISAGISFGVLYAFGILIKGAVPSIAQGLSTVGIGVIVLQAFMIGIFEELLFRGWLVDQLKISRFGKGTVIIAQAVIFAAFHSFMGKSVFTMLLYIPLGILFYMIKEKYSPQTNMANAGSHFAWNLFILGFLS